MGFPSAPDARRPLVIDVGVGLNLLATGCAPDILAAFDPPIMMDDLPGDKVTAHPRGPLSMSAECAELMARGLLSRMVLSGPMFETFVDLVGAPANDLGDGESAVLAYAHHTGSVAVLDGDQAHAVGRSRWPDLNIASTATLLADYRVMKRLGPERLQAAVCDALMVGHMRVLPDMISWVRSVVPADRLTNCPSLTVRARG